MTPLEKAQILRYAERMYPDSAPQCHDPWQFSERIDPLKGRVIEAYCIVAPGDDGREWGAELYEIDGKFLG